MEESIVMDDVIIEKEVTTNVAISVIVILNNLKDSIEAIFERLKLLVEQYPDTYEFIVVDDGSTDGTLDFLKKIKDTFESVRVIKLRSVFGEAAGFDAGLSYANGEKIVYFTGRVRIDPAGLAKFLKRLDEGADLVIGWRHPRKDSKLNQYISRIFNYMITKPANLKLHDINSGVLVAKRNVLQNIPFYGDMNNFIPVLAARQGYRVVEEQIPQLSGSFRKSRYVSEYIQRFLDIISVIFLTKYSKKPIHFLGFVGAIFTIAGLLIEFYLFVYRILQLGPIAGRPMLLLGALLLVIGIQMISIGLIGEMIIFTHAKEVKEYNIETIIE